MEYVLTHHSTENVSRVGGSWGDNFQRPLTFTTPLSQNGNTHVLHLAPGAFGVLPGSLTTAYRLRPVTYQHETSGGPVSTHRPLPTPHPTAYAVWSDCTNLWCPIHDTAYAPTVP